MPYRDDFITDLMEGVIDIAFVAPSVVMPFIQSGKLKALGRSGTKRANTLPNLPNFAEFGIKDVDIPAYSALLAPPKMPADVLAALHQGVVATLPLPALRAKFKTADRPTHCLTFPVLLPMRPSLVGRDVIDQLVQIVRHLHPIGTNARSRTSSKV